MECACGEGEGTWREGAARVMETADCRIKGHAG